MLMTVNKNKKGINDNNNPITKLSLAFVDEPIEFNIEEDINEGSDSYESKLGGLPAWLDKSIPIEVITCKLCSKPQVFLLQLYAPLPPKNLDRILYLFSCKANSCTKKAEGFTVIRVHNKVQRKNLKNDKVKKFKEMEESKPLFAPQCNNQNNFMLGNIWESSSNNNNGSVFGEDGTNNSPFSAPSGFFGSNNNQQKKQEEKEEDLVDKLNKLKINNKEEEDNDNSEDEEEELKAAPWPTDLPYYKPYYLAFDEEINESDSPIDLSKYKKYEDLIKEQIQQQQQNTNEEGGINWEGEGYEKTPLPHGMDKTFEHFGNIIQYYPEQCLRYQFNGNPLLYHNQDDISKRILVGKGKKQTQMSFDKIKACESCGGPRTFELQLMPQLLSYLTLNNNNSQVEDDVNSELNLQLKGQNFLDQFDLGMEFGTVLIFSCKNDCNLKSGFAFAKELAFPQHQL